MGTLYPQGFLKAYLQLYHHIPFLRIVEHRRPYVKIFKRLRTATAFALRKFSK